MQTFLEGIAKKAKARPEHRFGNLYEELNEEFLKECWRDIKKNAAYGVDEISARDYEESLEENIKQLVDRLKKKQYRAKLARRKYIPKGEGKFRPLGIPMFRSHYTSCNRLWNLSCRWTGMPSPPSIPQNRSLVRTFFPTLLYWLAQLGDDFRPQLDPAWAVRSGANAIQAAGLAPVSDGRDVDVQQLSHGTGRVTAITALTSGTLPRRLGATGGNIIGAADPFNDPRLKARD